MYSVNNSLFGISKLSGRNRIITPLIRNLSSLFSSQRSIPLLKNITSSFSKRNISTLLPHKKNDILGNRSHYISSLKDLPEGTIVNVTGWAERVRNMSNMLFFVLRDHTGKVQCIWEECELDEQSTYFKPLLENDKSLDSSAVAREGYDIAYNTSAESVVSIIGVIRRRPDDMIKKDQEAGSVEVRIQSFQILNSAAPMPITFIEAGASSKKSSKDKKDLVLSDEDSRLRYRFLDLRRAEMQRIIRTRAAMTLAARQVMYNQGFCEIETPYLVKSTPEGAREFLVPARNQGKFYALPQSPQQHKQLLMAAGMDRYFQIARCFRDEAGRADRQPEFTQLDLEVSFPSQRGIMSLIEGMVDSMHKRVYGVDLGGVPVIRFKDALNRFGSDKPDIRYQLELQDITDIYVDYAKTVIPQSYFPNTEKSPQNPVKIDRLLTECLNVNPTFLYTLHDFLLKGHCPITGLKLGENNEIVSNEGHDLARHPLPVVKAIVAREMGSELAKGKNKTLMQQLIGEIAAGSGGYKPVLMNTAKFNWKTDSNEIEIKDVDREVEMGDGESEISNVLIFNTYYQDQFVKKLNLGKNDFIFLVAGDWERVCNGLGKLRVMLNNVLPEENIDKLPPTVNGKVIELKQRTISHETTPSIDANGILSGEVLNTTGPLPVFHWVVDFPLFDIQIPPEVYMNNYLNYMNLPSNPSTSKVDIQSMHHPFTSPHPDDLQLYQNIANMVKKAEKDTTIDPQDSNIIDVDKKTWNNNNITNYPLSLSDISHLSQVRALHYDLCANGLEVGGGSIRIHNPEIQGSVFDILQVPHSKFQHLLEALSLGCPPHGGFAAGLDRLVAIFASQTSTPLKLRDVIAFPKTITGNDLLLGCPNPATQDQLDEYHIQVKK